MENSEPQSQGSADKQALELLRVAEIELTLLSDAYVLVCKLAHIDPEYRDLSRKCLITDIQRVLSEQSSVAGAAPVIPKSALPASTQGASNEPFVSNTEPAIKWNPWNKVVQDHRDGTIDHDRTEAARKLLGLPPWTPERAREEATSPPITPPPPAAPLLSEEETSHDFGRPGEGLGKCRRCDLGYVDAHLPCRRSPSAHKAGGEAGPAATNRALSLPEEPSLAWITLS